MRVLFKIIILVFFAAVLGLLFFYVKPFLLSPASLSSQQKRVCFDSSCFSVEAAKTEGQRQKGLMFRNELGQDKGMFFIFEKEGVYPFWMKNTLIPLDIIWLDKDLKAVFISKNTQPCQEDPCPAINPESEALYVLEINAGLADKLGIKAGSTAMWIK